LEITWGTTSSSKGRRVVTGGLDTANLASHNFSSTSGDSWSRSMSCKNRWTCRENIWQELCGDWRGQRKCFCSCNTKVKNHI